MVKPNGSMSGKVCMVTGSDSGIGKVTALGLAKMGATVVMVCLNQKQGEYGYAYDAPQEAAEFIKILLTNETTRKRMASAAIDRATAFDKAVFKRKIVRIAEKFHAQKSKIR